MVHLRATGPDPRHRHCTFVGDLHKKTGANCADQVIALIEKPGVVQGKRQMIDIRAEQRPSELTLPCCIMRP